MKRKRILPAMLALSMIMGMIPGTAFAEESNKVNEISYNIVNGDFESGDLTGWTILEGDAFAEGRVSNETMFWANGGEP